MTRPRREALTAGSPTRAPFYRLLERGWVYRGAQRLLAPGATSDIVAELRTLLRRLPQTDSLLDVGCGPSSWLWQAGLHPVGVDLSHTYLKGWAHRGETAVVASADRLPFPARTFGGVWCIGLLHHLHDALASRAIGEMLRVCRAGGYVAILDAVKPDRTWRRPVAGLLRRMDRGRFVRSEKDFQGLFQGKPAFACERITYSWHRLEMLVCTRTVPPPEE